MWVVRWALLFILFVILLGFGYQNNAELVTINFTKAYYIRNVQLIWALYVAFILGAFVMFVISIVKIVQLKTDIRRLRRGNERSEQELANLRNLSIDEDTSEPENGKSGTDQ